MILLTTFLGTAFFMLLLAFLLMYLPKARFIGGERLSNALCRAPILDLIVASFTWIPWLAGGLHAGFWGIVVAIAAQVAALLAWITYHEYVHADAVKGPTIFRTLNRLVGRVQNHAALWVTMIALPGFWFIRIMQIVCYPFLIGLLDFPRYKQSDWINVSRQKFNGLVGHDLIWCLYCDWMTGVYSLGAEMLRNVESFWCPIRFIDGKKCDNCKLDFPDVTNGWVAPTATMTDVVTTLEKEYGDGHREWFGHPARLTLRGQPIEK